MFRKKQAGSSGTVDADLPKRKFPELLESIKNISNYEKGVTVQAAFLDFAIHAIGRELEAETTARILHLSGEVPDERFELPNTPVIEEYVRLHSATTMQLPGPRILRSYVSQSDRFLSMGSARKRVT